MPTDSMSDTRVTSPKVISRITNKPYVECVPPPRRDPYVDIYKHVERIKPILNSTHFRVPAFLVTGGHGVGKTHMAWSIAAEGGFPIVSCDCTEDTRSSHLLGSLTQTGDGVLAWLDGPVTRAIRYANESAEAGGDGIAILAIEEISRLPPGVQVILNPLLDDRHRVELPLLGETVTVLPEARLIVFASANPASGYGGHALNKDLRSRMLEMSAGPLELSQQRELLYALRPTFKAADGAANTFLNRLLRLAEGFAATPANTYIPSTRDLLQVLDIWMILSKDEVSKKEDIGRMAAWWLLSHITNNPNAAAAAEDQYRALFP